ncbi:Os02g0641000 [Oryza sativa Japonica Group]|uniref:Os02g0641000 protein n=1 Tax=Oryza sativa subsp. japonica TaxID=39947 RepID=A0A0P0VM79_ORYSJ|nr:hypothetical protein EE612_012642 [Oryza sativa]BAS79989.1 Os02g0641000 [Oryza sativa Japonica Group]
MVSCTARRTLSSSSKRRGASQRNSRKVMLRHSGCRDGRAPSKLSSAFSGTQDKCAACQKTVYPLEKLTLEGESYHKSCFKCSHGGCILTTSSYAALNGILYCKIHFSQLFKEKGSYNHLIQTAQSKQKESEEAAPVAATEASEKEQEVPPQDAT